MLVRLSSTALTCAVFAVGCRSAPATSAHTNSVFADVDCKNVKLPSEPDLVAWEPAQRNQLDKLRKQGVVAVRYDATGCDVELELIPQCIGPKNKYVYSAFKANETRVAHGLDGLVKTMPVGAANVAGIVKDKGELRAEISVVGRVGLPDGTTVTDYDLVGPECKRATHVIGAVYVGGYVMGEQHEGDPRICQRAAEEGIELGGCSVPLRVALVGIGGRTVDPIATAPKTARAVEPLPEGKFDQASIERVVRDHQNGLKRACWSELNDGLRHITAAAAVTIDPRGMVSGVDTQVVEADGPADVAAAVARCISSEVRAWRFPEPGKPQRVTLPFHLLRQ